MKPGCRAEATGAPQAQLPTCHTRGVKLVQLVVDKGRIVRTGTGICLQNAVPVQAPCPACKPTAHPETLQQMADEVPEQAAGQVQVRGWQGPAQCLQGQPQLLGGLGEVPLRMMVFQVKQGQHPEHRYPSSSEDPSTLSSLPWPISSTSIGLSPQGSMGV